jgi:hypothetical protein
MIRVQTQHDPCQKCLKSALPERNVMPKKERNRHNLGIEKHDNYAEKSYNLAEQVMTLFSGFLSISRIIIFALLNNHYVAFDMKE